MAIDAGTVYYTVDANTQKAIDSASEIKTSLEQMQTAMAKTDVQTKQYVKTLTDAGNSISKAGVVLDEFGNINTQATAKMQKLMAMSDSLNQRHIQLSKTATGVKTGIAGIGRNAGQAAIQFQQLIGQIQGGQDVMLALSAQSADLGFILGAPLLGAVIGIGASLAGMLIPNLFKTTNALEDVEKATERVKAAITLSSEGITGYSEQMKVLAQVSDQLARIKIANLIADQANAMKVASTGINETISEFNGLNYQMDLFGNKSDDAYQAFIQLSQAAKSFEADPSGSITKLESALDAATRAGINNTEAGRGLVSQITDLIAQYKLGEITIDQLNKKLDESTIKFDDVGKDAEKAANNQKKWADNAERLTVKTEELRSKQLELEKAIAIKKATEEGATPETVKSMEASYDKIIANEKEAESERALAKAKREKDTAEREADRAKKSAMKEDQASADIMISLKSDSDNNKNLLGQLDPMEGEQQRYELELNNLKTLNEAKLIEDQRYLDLKTQAETKHEENMQALREQNFRAQSKNNELLMDSLDALGRAGTNAISGILSGTMSATQAMQSLANAVLNQAVGALVEMGMQYVKNQIMADTAATASIATASTTGTAIASAYTPAATAATIATQGGAVNAATASMATGIPAMSAMIMGGRLYGGDVQANGMYRINEDGRPEVFNAANGQQYMLPNSRGEVVSNKDATSGGSVMINVTVNADGSSSVDGDSQLKNVGAGFSQAVQMELNKSMRQGGALWQYMQSKKK
ncbi:hypothetical protein DET48_11421 [Vibrio diazotrophicus]|uniref:Tail length tape measure protein n=1 Tax=Vibrio diazotrophicus TaxID=685 RepID=A0A329E926_VIBDI|nr:hypothetical protein [Vibrio diazotrophicus]RAS62627.1 hypothetical protein DET48_11421 [Vibrio diazotrophicus]